MTTPSTSPALNLARKWRSRTFDEVVGQEMAISMLRNSLYKNHFFPVYLFAGQKGCGKTSTARILAAAANCDELATFQKDPGKTSIPCLKCTSCTSMYSSKHPDFIEIDAASHTGVDDVRALLESCSFMPLMGRKKIYLIDEAHMLSKAAFNAFLKVLEEPPAQVLFMMATTELHKIPETVRSRCFQMHFNAIDRPLLHDHLTAICKAEEIDCTPEALTLILHETAGSARDAINLLEQVRFANDTIAPDDVQKALGLVSPHRLGELFALMVENDPSKLLQELKSISFGSLNPTRLWQLFLGLLRTLLWQAYKVAPADEALLLPKELHDRITKSASITRLHAIIQLLWHQEELFLATPYKHAFLEKVFLDICTQINTHDLDELKELIKNSPPEKKKSISDKISVKPVIKQPTVPHALPPRPAPPTAPTVSVKPAPIPAAAPIAPASSNAQWTAVCNGLMGQNDPILLSIFQQAQIENVDLSAQKLTIKLANASPFFKEKINDAQALWQPLVRQHFACSNLIVTGATAPPPKPVIKRDPIPIPDRPPMPSASPGGAPPWQKRQAKRPSLPSRPRGTPLLLTDENKEKWPKAQLLLEHFPGKLELLGDVL